jgi:hypothetical protein
VAIHRDFELALEVDDVLWAQGADPAKIRSRSPLLVEVAERALAGGLPLLRPAVLYSEFDVERLTHERLALAGGGVLSGPLIRQHLASASRVAVIVCTIGPELEARVAQAMGSDFQYALALDGVGSAAAEALATAVCHQFEVQSEKEGWGTTTRISPGMVGWPVSEGQRQLFDLVNSEEIGVTLLPTGMMMPRKSLTQVIGRGRDVSADGEPCDYCSMGERCLYRSQRR